MMGNNKNKRRARITSLSVAVLFDFSPNGRFLEIMVAPVAVTFVVLAVGKAVISLMSVGCLVEVFSFACGRLVTPTGARRWT